MPTTYEVKNKTRNGGRSAEHKHESNHWQSAKVCCGNGYTEQMDFYQFPCKASFGCLNEGGCSFVETSTGNLPVGEEFSGYYPVEGRCHFLRCHCGVNARTTQTRKIGPGRQVRVR